MRERVPVQDFYTVNRGGGLWTRGVSQWGGAVAAAAAYRLRIHPSAMTVAGMVVGAITAVLVLVASPGLPDGSASERLLLGVGAWVGWQVAYALDCGDGQLARIAGQTSPAGGVVDMLCDVVTQALFVAALAAIVDAWHPDLPAWTVALAGSVWMLTLITSSLDKSGEDVSLIRAESLPVQVLKLCRDFGAQITAAAVLIGLWPSGILVFLAALTAVNDVHLLVLITRTALRSAQATPST